MAYFRYLIDASALDTETCRQICDLIATHTAIFSTDQSHPGVYAACFDEADLSILENPIFRDCKITNITQSGI